MAAGVIVCCGIGLALFFRYGWLAARVLFVLGGKPTVAGAFGSPRVRFEILPLKGEHQVSNGDSSRFQPRWQREQIIRRLARLWTWHSSSGRFNRRDRARRACTAESIASLRRCGVLAAPPSDTRRQEIRGTPRSRASWDCAWSTCSTSCITTLWSGAMSAIDTFAIVGAYAIFRSIPHLQALFVPIRTTPKSDIPERPAHPHPIRPRHFTT